MSPPSPHPPGRPERPAPSSVRHSGAAYGGKALKSLWDYVRCHGERIRITDQTPVSEPVIRRFNGRRAVLWEREIVDTAPDGRRVILASEGELYNLPAALLSLEWKDPKPIHRLKGFMTRLTGHLNTIGRSKYDLVKRLQDIQILAADLETRVNEGTGALEAVNEQLAKENHERKILEKRLWSSLKEKDMLPGEIQHRVKNNLQIISSLLSMSANRTRNREALGILTNARTKVETMAVTHSQLLGNQRAGVIDMKAQVIGLYQNLDSLYGKTTSTRFDTPTPSIRVSPSQAIPCALMLNELISNSLKHAFGDRSDGRLSVAFSQSGPDTLEMIYRDNGVGLPRSIGVQ